MKLKSVELFLCSFKQEIVLTKPNLEITHTFKLFISSVQLFICLFEFLAGAFGPSLS